MIKDDFEEYLKAVYPGRELPDFQNMDLRQAFYSGALVTIIAILKLAQEPNQEKGAACIAKVHTDIVTSMQGLIKERLESAITQVLHE